MGAATLGWSYPVEHVANGAGPSSHGVAPLAMLAIGFVGRDPAFGSGGGIELHTLVFAMT